MEEACKIVEEYADKKVKIAVDDAVKDTLIDVAKNLILAGLSDEQIAMSTKLSPEEINALRK